MDKIPWDGNAKPVIINDLTLTPKSIATFQKSVTCAPSPTQYNVDGQQKLRRCVVNIVCGVEGGAGHV